VRTLPRGDWLNFGFRTRLTVVTAAAIALAVAAASVGVFLVARHELRSQIDESLKARAAQASFGRDFFGPPELPPPSQFGGATGTVQLIRQDGAFRLSRESATSLPIGRADLAVASGERAATLRDLHVRGVHLRLLTVPLTSPGYALMIALPLTDTDRTLHRIGLIVGFVGGGGVAVAALLSALVAAAALRPIRRLTLAAEGVTKTGDLSARVDPGRADELGRLAAQFNAMLAALEVSVGAQRRLVADASHELRTPITAVRTNLELLREGKLPPEERDRALAESSAELEELSRLVADLVELARGQERRLRLEDVQLDDLVFACVERAQARAPQVVFTSSLTPTLVRADAMLIERAVSNLLDNAVKYTPAGSVVEVEVKDGTVTVRDQGPGIAADDLPHIFDRFYRAASARSKPGAGLGLAIVREAAEAHGGKATVESDSTGARFRLALPGVV